MSRDRLTERNRKQSRQQRTADPYTMNVERTNPPTEDYMTGDPDAWAETPVADLSRMDGTNRDELGLPTVDDTTWNHQDADDWNSGGSYDNEGGKLAAHDARVRLAEMQRHFEKKALQCIRIARALFPTASEAVIQEQALDFMPLPDDSVIATALRLAEDEDAKEDEGEGEGEESKEASLTPDQMLSQMLREAAEDEEEEEEEEESKEASDEEDAEEEDAEEDKESKKAQYLAMAKKLIQAAADEDEEEDDSAKEAAEEEEEEEEEEAEEEVESKKKSSADSILAQLMAEAGMEDMMDEVPMDMDAMDMHEEAPMGDDLDMMMAEMEEDMGYEATAELGLDLSPALDHLDSQALLESSDEVLQQLMSRQTTEAPKTASQKGVSQLGRVKEASSTGDSDLSKLWKSAPDVSSAFE